MRGAPARCCLCDVHLAVRMVVGERKAGRPARLLVVRGFCVVRLLGVMHTVLQ